jgi:hypothetical protein
MAVVDPLYLPESETRFLRLVLYDGPAHTYGLAEIDVKDLAFGASPNAFFEAIAREAPRGILPARVFRRAIVLDCYKRRRRR